MAVVALFSGCLTTQSASNEYEAMSLVELFKDNPEAMDKIGDLMVTVENGFNRTDMDVWDYTWALNKMAEEGWELVAVNKSNYWIFRREKK